MAERLGNWAINQKVAGSNSRHRPQTSQEMLGQIPETLGLSVMDQYLHVDRCCVKHYGYILDMYMFQCFPQNVIIFVAVGRDQDGARRCKHLRLSESMRCACSTIKCFWGAKNLCMGNTVFIYACV